MHKCCKQKHTHKIENKIDSSKEVESLKEEIKELKEEIERLKA